MIELYFLQLSATLWRLMAKSADAERLITTVRIMITGDTPALSWRASVPTGYMRHIGPLRTNPPHVGNLRYLFSVQHSWRWPEEPMPHHHVFSSAYRLSKGLATRRKWLTNADLEPAEPDGPRRDIGLCLFSLHPEGNLVRLNSVVNHVADYAILAGQKERVYSGTKLSTMPQALVEFEFHEGYVPGLVMDGGTSIMGPDIGLQYPLTVIQAPDDEEDSGDRLYDALQLLEMTPPNVGEAVPLIYAEWTARQD